MNKVNDISDELGSMGSSLGELPRSMPYYVPVGYFENFASSTQQLLKEVEEPETLQNWGRQIPFEVPAGYFDHFSAAIIDHLHSNKVLPGMPDVQPLQVPPGYFEALPALVLAKVKAVESEKKKQITIPLGRVYSLRSIRWAAAAIFLFFISVGGAFYFQRPASEADMLLASVPKNDIMDYLQGTYRIDVNRVINTNVNSLQVDNKAIVEYLNETGWDVTE